LECFCFNNLVVFFGYPSGFLALKRINGNYFAFVFEISCPSPFFTRQIEERSVQAVDPVAF